MSMPLLICDIVAFAVLSAIVVYVFIFSSKLKKTENISESGPSKKHLNILMTIMIIAIVLVIGLIILNTIVAFLVFLK